MSTDTTLLTSKTHTNYISSHTPTPFISLSGVNPLVAAAMPLILLLIKFKETPSHKDVGSLRRQVISEIAAFEAAAKAAQCSPRLILAARYCLCTALDEVVLLTPWGNDSVWAQQTLLSIIQKETWGGERFFIILEKMAEEPKQNLPLLELIYILLSLGFEGKYYNHEKAVRDEIRHRLFRLIMMHREDPHRKLSPSLTILEKVDSTDTRRTPKWKIAAVTIGSLLALGLLFNIATYFSDRKTLQELNDINQQIPGLTVPSQNTHKVKTHNRHQESNNEND